MNLPQLTSRVALISLVALTGCRSVYYAAWEKLGKEKRHLLRDNVEKAQSEQQQASEEFVDALTRLKEMYGLDGGKLEAMYRQLEHDYNACSNRAQAISDRIQSVDRIANDLFAEWEMEMTQITNPQFRAQSREQLAQTQLRYRRLYDALKQTEQTMTPVLVQLKDHVLYLKHNLNAQAIGALKSEIDSIENEINVLIKDMQHAIRVAGEFAETL